MSYNISASVGRDGAVPTPLNTVIDTGLKPDLIHKRNSDPAQRSHILLVQSPRLFDAPKRVMRSCSFIYLTTRIEGFRVRVPLLTVQNLAVDCLLGTSFFDYHVKRILPGLRKAVFYHSLFCFQNRSMLLYKARNIHYSRNRRRTAESPDNAERSHSASVSSNRAIAVADHTSLPRLDYPKASHLAPHVDDEQKDGRLSTQTLR